MKSLSRFQFITSALFLCCSFCFAESPPRPLYTDHSNLMIYRDLLNQIQPVKTTEDWSWRRQHILIGMQEAMGPLPAQNTRPPFDLKVIAEQKGNGWLRQTISFAAEERSPSEKNSKDDSSKKQDRITAYLYLPLSRKQNERRPAMLALHPTGALGKGIVAGESNKANREYGRELAERGYVVLCPDYPSFGELSNYDFTKDRYVSGTMKGIFNHMRCVDFLQSRSEVDRERIGVIGHSLGGHNAMFVAAFDERLKVIVSSCGWTPFHDYYKGKIAGWTSDRYMPLLKTKYKLDPDRVPFDFYEVVASLAPRPFFSNSPLRDANFDYKGVKKAEPKTRTIYDLFQKKDRLQIVYPDCAHDFPVDIRKQAYSFIDRALKFDPVTGKDFQSELPRIKPLGPKEALKSFRLKPGYRIEQIASEPLVTDPVAMSFDEHHRLYVVEMKGYSEQENELRGQIRLLEDTNDDGKYDRSFVFASGLSWPTAIICYNGGVFVGAAPDIWYFKDSDGDHRADVKRKVFTGFGKSNVQGLLNSFRWGLDNRIHGATSSSGGIVKHAETAKQKENPPVNLRGGDFSFDPVTETMRRETGGAQHGLSFDDWGRKYVCSNSDHIQIVQLNAKYLTRNRLIPTPSVRRSIAADGPQAEVYRASPVEPWRLVRTRLRKAGLVRGPVEGGGRAAGYFTGSTGVTLFRGDAWKESERGLAFIGDVGSNIVHRKRIERKNGSVIAFRMDDESEFLSSTDIWFRPVQFANGPDGALHILDMYREVIEHPKSLPPEIKRHLDLTSGRNRGRLYRVIPQNFQQRFRTKPGELANEELIELLGHPNSWHRETASRLLYERIASGTLNGTVIPSIHEMVRKSNSALGRLHALYLLHSSNRLNVTRMSVLH